MVSIGQWDQIRQEALGNVNLANAGFSLGLRDCVVLNPGRRAGDVSVGMMATSVEAKLGAVHLDGSDAALTAVMEALDLFSHSLLAGATVRPQA